MTDNDGILIITYHNSPYEYIARAIGRQRSGIYLHLHCQSTCQDARHGIFVSAVGSRSQGP